MRVLELLYDSARASETGQRIAERVEERPETVETADLGTDNREDAQREAMLSVGAATRIGSKPEALFDEDGNPDFADGAIITEDERGRRDLHVGDAALEALHEE